jgi:hypothetical protein
MLVRVSVTGDLPVFSSGTYACYPQHVAQSINNVRVTRYPRPGSALRTRGTMVSSVVLLLPAGFARAFAVVERQVQGKSHPVLEEVLWEKLPLCYWNSHEKSHRVVGDRGST